VRTARLAAFDDGGVRDQRLRHCRAYCRRGDAHSQMLPLLLLLLACALISHCRISGDRQAAE